MPLSSAEFIKFLGTAGARFVMIKQLRASGGIWLSTCGKNMKSIGKDQGYRCKKCGTKLPEESADYETVERELEPGFYEVPVCARRHLSKPLQRL